MVTGEMANRKFTLCSKRKISHIYFNRLQFTLQRTKHINTQNYHDIWLMANWLKESLDFALSADDMRENWEMHLINIASVIFNTTFGMQVGLGHAIFNLSRVAE